MHRSQILRKFLIPGSVLSAIAIKEAKDKDAQKGQLVRPSELPIYSGEHCRPPRKDPCSGDGDQLVKTVGAVRRELWVWYDEYKGYREKIIDILETGKAHTAAALDYLKEEDNNLPRAGAIGLSGLAGYVLGMRGGILRRLTYASIASLAMAGFCYPTYGAMVSHEALFYTKKAVAITYNFIYGVKPEGLKLPSPANLLEDQKLADDRSSPVPGGMTEPVRKKEEVVMPVVETEELPTGPEEPTPPSQPTEPVCICPEPVVTPPPIKCPGTNQLDLLAEQAADVMYWGFRIT